MPARKRRIVANSNGEAIKRQVAHKPEYWSIETDDHFSVFITTDGSNWAIIEGSTAVMIPDDILSLVCETKQMYDRIMAEGRTLKSNRGPGDVRTKDERIGKAPVDRGKVLALWEGGWSIDRIYKECEMDGVSTTKREIERIIKHGRD